MNGNYTTDPGVLVGFYGPGEQANFRRFGLVLQTLALPTCSNRRGGTTVIRNTGPSGYFGISDVAQDVLVGGNPYPSAHHFWTNGRW